MNEADNISKKSRHCYQQWIFFHLFPNKDLSEQTKLPTIISTCSNLTTTESAQVSNLQVAHGTHGTTQLLYQYQDLPQKKPWKMKLDPGIP